jgi:RNA polymerase sigma-70 factor, ECF subfamily
MVIDRAESVEAPQRAAADCALIALAPEKEINSFLLAAEQYRSKFLGLARRLTRNPEDAEDIVQHALLKAYKGLHRFRGEAQMSTWLRTIVQNTALEHLRERKRRVFVSIENFFEEDGFVVTRDFPDPQRNPEEQCERDEMIEALRAEVGRLSPAARDAVQICLLEECSQTQAACALNTSSSAIKASVCRGKRILTRTVLKRLQRSNGSPHFDRG